jgi:hypothetical protein
LEYVSVVQSVLAFNFPFYGILPIVTLVIFQWKRILARLQRSSRCFSRCFKALARAVELFVYFYNERQLKKRKYPKYPAYLAQNLPTLI